ncbi:MAG: hypothetical protein MB55_04530 [marine actinobacterium MedAcidi-G3]|nr:MAG: hypothetical protein MB55_04530 [marine actinobacterium MedAcidi-G3]MAR53281.1 hypothetical protein [Acidimicrobiaceae bacterium]MBA4812971.1 hypothetical protein [Acidimicrobiales bacterium]OUW86579.1 MAG: hypothetical protein CBD84_05035 [Acidimicrobiaceae bacterium TMED224]MBD51679.1 hypothetical protein [Acidimicrobiaceae bacterium]
MISPIVGTIHPAPTDEEAAAIAAGIEVLWPEPMQQNIESPRSNWRFSGRWWGTTSRWPTRSY